MRSVQIEGQLHLCLFALTNLPSGIELRYSYGVPGLPWRKVISLPYIKIKIHAYVLTRLYFIYFRILKENLP